MDIVKQIEAYQQAYFSSVENLLSTKRLGDGLWGFGNDPKKDPCHMVFYESVEQTIARSEDSFSAQERDQVVSTLLYMDKLHPEQPEMVKLMLQAVQTLALPLIPVISPSKAGELREWYDAFYPRKLRMPNQTKVLNALIQRERESG